jgi:site-specific DNA-adenine methylase
LEAAVRSVEKTAAVLKASSAKVLHSDYSKLDVRLGDLVYCDPPYQNTQGYSTGGFNHEAFWETMRRWTRTGARVVISESSSPVDFRPWATRTRKAALRATKGTEQAQRNETLFVYQP